MQSVMSATDMLGHRDVHGLSTIDLHLRQWICVCTMPKDVGMPLVTVHHMSVRGDNSTPFSNDGIAQLGLME